MWVNIYGDDMDFIALGVIVNAYINSVDLLLFSPLDPCLGGFLFGSFCLLEVLLHLISQWPILPHDWDVESLAGKEALPDAWDLVQFSHACWFLGFKSFCCCCCGQDWSHQLHLVTALTVLDQRPIALRLSAMAMWVLHVLSILAVVALRSRATNILTSSLSVRAWTRQNWIFCSFSSSVAKLHLLVRALRWSTNSFGVSPALILTSSNWYIWHNWDTVWSIWDSKWFRMEFSLFLVATISSVVAPAGVHWFHFWQALVLRKFSIYSRWAPLSSGSSGIAWRWNQPSVDS